MRSILLHVADDRCLEARLAVTLDLARAFAAHVSCVQTMPLENVGAADTYGALAASLTIMLRERAEACRATVEPRLASGDVPWDWTLEDGAPSYALQAHAALADLAVVGACDELAADRTFSSLAASLAIYGRTPLLVVPQGAGRIDPAAPVAVAWNGSPEACHAVRAAVPLLARASAVHLLVVTEPGKAAPRQLPPLEAAEYLSRHGIASTVTELPSDGGVAATLNHAATARGASCLVMGAYGHTRLREVLLGGVSRSLLSDPALPLFMVH